MYINILPKLFELPVGDFYYLTLKIGQLLNLADIQTVIFLIKSRQSIGLTNNLTI